MAKLSRNEVKILMATFVKMVKAYPEVTPLDDYPANCLTWVHFGQAWTLGSLFTASGLSWTDLAAIFDKLMEGAEWDTF